MATKEDKLRMQFFQFIFDDEEGYLCIATGTPIKGKKDRFEQSFFRWPDEKREISTFLEKTQRANIWFGINLLEIPERKKENCKPTNLVWADLDTCNPSLIEPYPQVVIETSPGRWQSIWKLSETIAPETAEEYSRRIFKKYSSDGADSGWALTKLLRVPFTTNFKYPSMPPSLLTQAETFEVTASQFEQLIIDELSDLGEDESELPDLTDLPTVDEIMYAHRLALRENESFKLTFNRELSEKDNWSKELWKLINLSLEAGMTKEETLVIAAASKCNKYSRDDRPLRHLWLDVVKAAKANITFSIMMGEDEEETIHLPDIVDENELKKLEHTFIDDYIDWGCSVTDASQEYHELGGAVLLSAMLADKIHLNTSWGTTVPNLWGLVLGESTLTRKTTAMDMAMDFVIEHDSNSIIATQDSSVEGLFTALSGRPNKVSIYYRDEVAGFFDAMSSKSYLAGMPELLTKLYDSPNIMTRQLKSGSITITKPVFIFYGGGILERIYSIVNQDFFFSGFMPRFLVVSGEANLEDLKWIGPAKRNGAVNPRNIIRNKIADLVEIYASQTITNHVLGQEKKEQRDVEVVLTDEAWEKVRNVEQTLTYAANKSTMALIALPTFTRLSVSMLKIAMLIAASRQEPKDFEITVELRDVIKAAHLIQKWSVHSIDLMVNVGKSTSERELQRVLKWVKMSPGKTRAELMRRFHLNSINTKIILTTLEDRGLIVTKSAGRGFRIWPV